MSSPEVAAAVISALAAVASGFFAWRAVAASREQQRLEAKSVIGDYLRDVREWAARVIDTMTEAYYLCDPSLGSNLPDLCVRKHNCVYRLSALTDEGRFYLPNEYHEEIGTTKEPAYRGLRHPALDCIINALQTIEKMDCAAPQGNTGLQSVIVSSKRQFVSVTQAVLDPREQRKDIVDLVSRERADYAAKLFEQLTRVGTSRRV
jgi:hypothetical protein